MRKYISSVKSILILAVGLLFSQASNGQNCADLKVGNKLKLEIKTYPLIGDKYGAAFYGMKPNKKAEKAEEYSKELSGDKVNPVSVYTLDYTIAKVTADGEYEQSTEIAGKTYSSYVACKENNLYIIRIKQAMVPNVFNGDTLGFLTKGTQIIPQNIKVGDLTPGYVDESIMTYKTSDIKNVNFAIGDASYNGFSGTTTLTSYSGYVRAKVNTSIKGKTLYIYQSGVVLGEENMMVSGKTYKCFKVRTEIWTKNDTKMDTEYELNQWFSDPKFNKQIHSQMQSNADKASIKVKAKMDDMLGTNKSGYIVTYKEEWICPTFGVLRTDSYDQWGCLQSRQTVVAID